MQSCSCASRSWACAWYVSGIGEEQKLENWFLGRVDSSLLLYSVHAYVSQVKVKTDTASIMLIEADYKNENSWAERTDWGKSAEICLMHFRWNWWNRLEWTLPSLWLWLPCRCELFWLRSAHNLFCAMTIRTKGVGCEGRQTTCESLHEKPSFNIHHMRLPDSGDHVEGIGTKLNGSKTQHNALHMLTLSWWQSTINWSWLSAKWMPQLRRGRCEHSTAGGYSWHCCWILTFLMFGYQVTAQYIFFRTYDAQPLVALNKINSPGYSQLVFLHPTSLNNTWAYNQNPVAMTVNTPKQKYHDHRRRCHHHHNNNHNSSKNNHKSSTSKNYLQYIQ